MANGDIDSSQKPLVPRTIAGGATVAVPLVAVVGWFATETLQLERSVAENRQELENRGARFEKGLEDLVKLDERLVATEIKIQFFLEALKAEDGKTLPID